MRFDSPEDLKRSLSGTYVSYKGVPYYAQTVDLKLVLSDEKGKQLFVDASEEFNVALPNLGFVPVLLRNMKEEYDTLYYVTRSALRQWQFGVSARTYVPLVTEVFGSSVIQKARSLSFPNHLWWKFIKGSYQPFKVVLENGGGLNKNYGITKYGEVIFSNSNIGLVTPQKDGIILFDDFFYNSIIRDDLEEQIGVKRIIKGSIKDVEKR